MEHDAEEIWANVEAVVAGALAKAGASAADLVAASASPTSARRTVVWDRRPASRSPTPSSGRTPAPTSWSPNWAARPARTASATLCGLPLATYFSGPKLRWLLDTVAGPARARAERGELLFGTMDAWLIWKLTGRHVTDVTNARRTMLMNLATLDWDDELLDAIGVPRAMLPEIRPSSEVYGTARGALAGVPVAAALGDQQAALFGQTCF